MGKLWAGKVCGGGNQEFGLGQTLERPVRQARGALGNPGNGSREENADRQSLLATRLFKAMIMQET